MSTHTPHVIGLAGPAGSGKDTVAELLATHRNAHALAFADALRTEVVEAFCITHSMLTQRETKEHPMSALALSRCLDHAFVYRLGAHHFSPQGLPGVQGDTLDIDAPRSPRQIMQWWGTEYRRAMQRDYWTSKAVQHVQWLHKARAARLVVITDVRFADEAELVRRLGGQIWQIKRPGCDVATDAHTSEVTGEAFAPDVVINNSYDIAHLQQLVLNCYDAQHSSKAFA